MNKPTYEQLPNVASELLHKVVFLECTKYLYRGLIRTNERLAVAVETYLSSHKKGSNHAK